MTDHEIANMLESVHNLADENTEGFVFIAAIRDENGRKFTIRTHNGFDSHAIGMMQTFIHDLMVSNEYRPERSDETEET